MTRADIESLKTVQLRCLWCGARGLIFSIANDSYSCSRCWETFDRGGLLSLADELIETLADCASRDASGS